MLKNFFTKNPEKITFVQKIAQITILTTVFISPLFTIPLSESFMSYSKTLIMLLAALIACVLSIIYVFQKKKWEVILSPFTVPLLIYSLAIIASIFFTQTYPAEGLLGMGGFYLAGIILAIAGGSLMPTQKSKAFIKFFSLSAIILTISSILQLIGFGPSKIFNLIPGFNVPNNLVFNLAGSSLIALQVLLLALLGLIIHIKNSGKKTIFDYSAIVIIIIGIIIHAWSIFPGKIVSIAIPNIKSSLVVASKTFSTPKSAIIGYGSESYTDVFSKFKPTSINNMSYWQSNFESAINYPLTIIVTMGVFGLLSWIIIVFQTLKLIPKSKTDAQSIIWIIVGTFLLQLLLPANLVVITIQVTAMAYLISILKNNYSVLQLKAAKPNHWIIENQPYTRQASKKTNKPDLFFIISIAIPTIIIIMITYLISRAYLAYYYQNVANRAIVEGNALNVFNYNKKATVLNPYSDDIRRQLALSNLQIAIALSNNPQATDEDKEQVTPLISQAIQEAKEATLINENNTQNWLALGEIYKNLISTTAGADQWALDSYIQAAQEDPVNPITRIEIGHLFLNKGQYDEAISFYTQAIQLKPDLPVGYYHLGNALVQNKQFDQAKSIWEQTLTLLDSDSQDYQTVINQLQNLETETKE
jgi:tetratricopeptide (TPR) repeat protein